MAEVFPGKKRKYVEKVMEDRTNKTGPTLTNAVSFEGKKNGTLNPSFQSESTMDMPEVVHRTKLWLTDGNRQLATMDNKNSAPKGAICDL